MNNTRRKEIQEVLNELADLRSRVDTLHGEEQEAYDNMPESLQQSERGQAAENMRIRRKVRSIYAKASLLTQRFGLLQRVSYWCAQRAGFFDNPWASSAAEPRSKK